MGRKDQASSRRVVEERESEDGELKEVSRNFFAFCKKTGNLFYFGEEVDDYDSEGNVVSHSGGWRAGGALSAASCAAGGRTASSYGVVGSLCHGHFKKNVLSTRG